MCNFVGKEFKKFSKMNPFPTTTYLGSNFFCDREEETHRITNNLKNQINTALFSYRRLGKTSLIHHVFEQFKTEKEVLCIYLDIFGTENFESFLNELATAIYNNVPKQRSLATKIIEGIQKLRPTISFDELSGTPNISFNITDFEQQQKTLAQLFHFIDKQKLTVFIAIDEFQQILEYPEKNTDAILRTQLQKLKTTNFVFLGSHQKMMNELFNSAKRPFFGSCENMQLNRIEKEKYVDFIVETFDSFKQKIDLETANYIYNWCLGHTFYVQFFCNKLFALGKKSITIKEAKSIAYEILKQSEANFYQFKNLMSQQQWRTLVAIAKEEKLYHPNSSSFLQKNNLGAASSVKRAIEALEEKEMIFYNASVEKPYYEVYNKFLMRWIQHK